MGKGMHSGGCMYKVNPDIVYVEQKVLQKIADKCALDEYMQREANEKSSKNVECLFQQRLQNIAKSEMHKLPQESQVLLHLRFWKDLTDEQISAQLKIRGSDVNTLLSLVLADLKRSIVEVLKQQYRFHMRDILCSND